MSATQEDLVLTLLRGLVGHRARDARGAAQNHIDYHHQDADPLVQLITRVTDLERESRETKENQRRLEHDFRQLKDNTNKRVDDAIVHCDNKIKNGVVSKNKIKKLKLEINGLRHDDETRDKKVNEVYEKCQSQDAQLTEIVADVWNLTQSVRENNNELRRMHGSVISSQETVIDFQNKLNGVDAMKQRLISLEQQLPTISSTQTELQNIRDNCNELSERIRYQEETTKGLSKTLSELEQRFNHDEEETRRVNSEDLDNLRSDVKAIREEIVVRDNRISELSERNVAVDTRLEDLCGKASVLESASNDLQTSLSDLTVRLQQAEGDIGNFSDALDNLTDRQDKVDQRLQADLIRQDEIRAWQEQVTERLETDLTRLAEIRVWQDNIDDRLETDRTRLEEIRGWQDNMLATDRTRLEKIRQWQQSIEDRLDADLNHQDNVNRTQNVILTQVINNVQRLDQSLFGIGENLSTQLQQLKTKLKRVTKKGLARGKRLHKIASFSKKLLHTYRIMFSRVIDLDSQVKKAAELSEKEIFLLEQRVVKAEDKYLYLQSASKDTQTELSPIGFTAAPRGLVSTVVRRGEVVQNFTDVAYNKDGYFNPSTGAFTAPVAGLYYTSLTMSKMNQGRIDLHVKHRPENSGRSDRPVKIVCRAHSGQDETSSTGAGLCYLETGDSLYVVAVTVSQDAVLNCYSSFSCFLVS